MHDEQPRQDHPEPRWISVEEAGRRMGLGRARAYQLVHEGVLPALKISERRLLVPARALDELENAVIERAHRIANERAGSLSDAVPGPLKLTARHSKPKGGRL